MRFMGFILGLIMVAYSLYGRHHIKYRQVTICFDGVSASVTGMVGIEVALDHAHLHLRRTIQNSLNQVIPFEVNMGINLMRDLTRKQ